MRDNALRQNAFKIPETGFPFQLSLHAQRALTNALHASAECRVAAFEPMRDVVAGPSYRRNRQ